MVTYFVTPLSAVNVPDKQDKSTNYAVPLQVDPFKTQIVYLMQCK